MIQVTNKQHHEEILNFINKHGDYRVITSPFENNSYNKNYIFEDDAVWTEIYTYEYIPAEVTVKGLEFTFDVKVFRTEYFNTDTGTSKYIYEKA